MTGWDTGAERILGWTADEVRGDTVGHHATLKLTIPEIPEFHAPPISLGRVGLKPAPEKRGRHTICQLRGSAAQPIST